MYGTELKL